ncbi:GNAT family N-acetyltransferase [marine bacterium AO1-C]|nr:GNAT family N-acetyltransferase [marine bacterium AO1-C]
MINYSIREENQEDYPQIYQLNALAFGQKNESKLVEKLRQTAHYIPELSLVATIEEKVIGFILFTHIQIIENKLSYPSLALAPMAVHPDFQKEGIGSQLVKAGLDKAQKLGHPSVIVLGHPQYYPRFGFVSAARWNIRCPFEVPQEVFMALELNPGSLDDTSGIVRYADAFAEV